MTNKNEENTISTVQRFHPSTETNKRRHNKQGRTRARECTSFRHTEINIAFNATNDVATTMRREKKSDNLRETKGNGTCYKRSLFWLKTPGEIVFISPLVRMDCSPPLLHDISKIFVVDTRGIYSIVIRYKKKLCTDRMPGYASPSVASPCSIRYQS